MTEALSLWHGHISFQAGPTMAGIVAEVAERHGVTVESLRGTSVKRAIAHKRQEAMWMMAQTRKFSCTQIGRFFGRDHSTVIHACRAYERRLIG